MVRASLNHSARSTKSSIYFGEKYRRLKRYSYGKVSKRINNFLTRLYFQFQTSGQLVLSILFLVLLLKVNVALRFSNG